MHVFVEVDIKPCILGQAQVHVIHPCGSCLHPYKNIHPYEKTFCAHSCQNIHPNAHVRCMKVVVKLVIFSCQFYEAGGLLIIHNWI